MNTSNYRQFPDISTQSIFFPYDEEQHRYRSSFYEDNMTRNQVSKQEINTFLSGLNQSSPNFEKFKRLPKHFYYMLGAGLASLIVGCIVIFYARYGASSRGLTLLGFLFVLAGFYLLFKSITSFIDEQTDLLQQTKLHITDYVGKNEENFRNKHLMWKTPQDHFEWIELTVAPSMKSKSTFSEKETAISINDNTFRRNNDSLIEATPRGSTPFLTNLI